MTFLFGVHPAFCVYMYFEKYKTVIWKFNCQQNHTIKIFYEFILLTLCQYIYMY